VAAARAVLEEGVHQLADTVRNSLNFYRMQESAEQVEQGVLTGAAVAIPGFVEALSEQLRLPLRSAVVESQDAEADLGRLTVAAGLAVHDVA
jgi:type IV pilus assembly protein PilM